MQPEDRPNLLLSWPHDGAGYRLRLYVAGVTVRSLRAVANARALCEEYLGERYDLEVVDIFQQPILAVQSQVLAVPALVRQFPLPSRQLIGDLSCTERVLAALDLQPRQWK